MNAKRSPENSRPLDPDQWPEGADADWLGWFRLVGPEGVTHLQRATDSPGKTLCDLAPRRPLDAVLDKQPPRHPSPHARSMCPDCIAAAS